MDETDQNGVNRTAFFFLTVRHGFALTQFSFHACSLALCAQTLRAGYTDGMSEWNRPMLCAMHTTVLGSEAIHVL